jgi:transposase
LLSQIATENQFIEELECKMGEYLAQIPYSKFILSIKGLGIVTVAGLIGEFGDFRNFDTCGEVIKMAGLNLYEVSSGDHTGQRRISKRGRSLIRKFLYYASLRIVTAHGVMREKYQQLIGRGMLKMKALVCIMRKLLRTIFALVRDGSRYNDTQEKFSNYKLAA